MRTAPRGRLLQHGFSSGRSPHGRGHLDLFSVPRALALAARLVSRDFAARRPQIVPCDFDLDHEARVRRPMMEIVRLLKEWLPWLRLTHATMNRLTSVR